MKLQEIMSEWAKDCVINPLDPTGETIRSAKLHSKYWSVLLHAMHRHQTLDVELRNLKAAKQEWFQGTLADEEMTERGWKPYQKRVPRADIPALIENDPDVVDLTLRLGTTTASIKFVESILKQIAGRNYEIKNIVDWERFKAGH